MLVQFAILILSFCLSSSAEFRNEESKFLSKQMPLTAIDNSIVDNQNSLLSLRRSSMELDDQLRQAKYQFSQSLNTLKNDIESWKQRYLLIAPVSGVVSFSQIIQESQDISTNTPVFFITPSNDGYYGEIFVPQTNFGKLKIDQKVIIKLASYPYQEYGNLMGLVKFISKIPVDGKYAIKVELINGLHTTDGTLINFSNDLTATGEIITDKARLISKFLYPIKGFLNDH